MNSKTKNRAVKVFERIIELANAGHEIRFSEDFGTPALTVGVGKTHFHTYPVVTSTEEFIDYLYNNLKEPTDE